MLPVYTSYTSFSSLKRGGEAVYGLEGGRGLVGVVGGVESEAVVVAILGRKDEAAPGNEFQKDEKVATAMGGMGRQFDGGYAEYTCVPAKQVQAFTSDLPWEMLGALPEMLQTA